MSGGEKHGAGQLFGHFPPIVMTLIHLGRDLALLVHFQLNAWPFGRDGHDVHLLRKQAFHYKSGLY